MKLLKYSDICLIPSYSECISRSDCDTSVRLGKNRFKNPAIPANMKSVINENLCHQLSENGYFYVMHRFDVDITQFVLNASTNNWKTISISVGVKDEDIELIKQLGELCDMGEGRLQGGTLPCRVDYITIDIAHGHSLSMKRMIEYVKENLPHAFLIAGNVATKEGVRDLYSWGADAIKVGIGQGSPCTTKDKTGFTIPMFSCVKECAHSAMTSSGDFISIATASASEDFDLPSRIPIIADGGVKCNRDIAKALVGGADMVMCGGIFAQCSDSPAETVNAQGKSIKSYYGSASIYNKKDNKHIEGIMKHLPASNLTFLEKMKEITEDLKSSISYAGGKSILKLRDTSFEIY